MPLYASLLSTFLLLPAGDTPGGFAPIRYDDCGAPGKQPHVLSGGVWTFGEDRVTAPLAARTVAFDGDAVRLRYDGLAPNARYRLRVTYTTERDQARTQTLYAGKVLIHPDLALPQGEARSFEHDVPPEALADGTLELSFRHVAGPNAVVSEVWLLSDVAQPELAVSLESDLHGALTVQASDGAQRPLSGAQVAVAAPAVNEAKTTDAEGAARFDLARVLAEHPEGNLTVTVRAGTLTATRFLAADAVLFRRPVLTPIPEAVPGVHKPACDLSGKWRFSPAPPDQFWKPETDDSAWPTIDVPGEWVMQSFTVAPNTAAGYRLTFEPPSEWRGQRVKIRFDAVFSRCEVWLNGTHVGGHEGGFTPFEVEVTEALVPGQPNVLALAVTSEGLADTLASASSYARHPLGGISRKVTAYVVPESHLTRFHAQADLAPDLRSADLRVMAQVVGRARNVDLVVDLLNAEGRSVGPSHRRRLARADGSVELTVPVSRPQLWDPEHPTLYELTGELLVDGQVVERVSRRIGFRRIEVRGAEVLVNGRPVKLHGVCRHEVDPKRGRSLTPAMWRRDVELLKGANINYVRTAHYPPAEEFLDLCDEAGIFVQDEGPWCWVSGDNANSPQTLGLMLRSNAEMIERDRSHPCVLIWDLANESSWGENFRRIHEYTRAEDPSRPTLFSGGNDADVPHGRPDGTCEIGSWHYPGPGGAASTAKSPRPVTFDEYCHLNCYNPDEVTADPGLRDYWGRALQPMWDEMQRAPSCLGGSIWCWADDLFDVPNFGRVGYGEWGVVDGTRRPKPEWWHVRKSYSPVRVPGVPLPVPAAGASLSVPVENRFDFTNLSQVRCEWRMEGRKGVLSPDIPPRSQGTLTIPAPADAGDVLSLRFVAGGRLVDEYTLPVGPVAPTRPAPSGPKPELRTTPDKVEINGDWFTVEMDRGSDAPLLKLSGAGMVACGPRLVASQLGTGRDAFQDAAPTTTATTEVGGRSVTLKLAKTAAFGPVAYALTVYGDGTVDTSYEARYTGPAVDVREVGLQWALAGQCRMLSWRRQGQWTEYPDDHIGRLVGQAEAFPLSVLAPRPGVWGSDADDHGANDFRSTKYNVLEASLTSDSAVGLCVWSDGQQHVRARVAGRQILWRICDFSNGGGEGFLSAHYAADRRTVKPGEVLRGTMRMQLLRQ